jgi:hypothetical protein
MINRITLLLFIGLAWGQDWSLTLGQGNGRYIQQTQDNGYVIIGNNGNADAFMIKINEEGSEVWNNSYDISGSPAFGMSGQQTQDGGYVIIGFTEGNAWLIKTDSLGSQEWQQFYGSSSDDIGLSILQTTDNGYIFSGIYDDDNITRIIKTDSLGNEEWSHDYIDLTHFNGAPGNQIQHTSEGGYVLVGSKWSNDSHSDIWITKIDSIGNEEWSQTFDVGGTDIGNSIQQTQDGGYIILGHSLINIPPPLPMESNIILIKTDEWGNEVWNKIFSQDTLDYGLSIQNTLDGGFILAGSTSPCVGCILQNGLLIKTNSFGEKEWDKIIGSVYQDEITYIIQNNEGNYISTGYKNGQHIWLLSQQNQPEIKPYFIYSSDYVTSEDTIISIPLYAHHPYNLPIFFNAIDNPEQITTDIDSNIITISPNENWNGTSMITVIVSDTLNNSDTTSFDLIVNAINDEPEDFSLIYPTSSDTLFINTDTDNAYTFYWEASNDVDSEINYSITITLDYFGDIYSETYQSIDSSIIVSGYEWSTLMTNLNLERRTLHYVVEATDGEYTIESENGEFVFENTSVLICSLNVLYPTASDTFSSHIDNDTGIEFVWEGCNNVNNDITYRLTIELEFFENIYADVYDNLSDTTINIPANNLDPLLNALNLSESEFRWYVDAYDENNSIMSDTGQFFLTRELLEVKDRPSLPFKFALHQNHPNPFNPATTLRYDIPGNAFVNIRIYDLKGRLINTLVSKEQTAGYKAIKWAGVDDKGKAVSAGIYLYEIQAGNFRDTKKMVLLR